MRLVDINGEPDKDVSGVRPGSKPPDLPFYGSQSKEIIPFNKRDADSTVITIITTVVRWSSPGHSRIDSFYENSNNHLYFTRMS